jgi:hypothetical protein
MMLGLKRTNQKGLRGWLTVWLTGGRTWRDPPGCGAANFGRRLSGGRSPARPLEPVLGAFLF